MIVEAKDYYCLKVELFLIRKMEYPWTDQTYFNGKQICICENKVLNKMKTKRRYAKIEKCRYINQNKIQKPFVHTTAYVLYVTCTLTNMHIYFSCLLILCRLVFVSLGFT